MLQFSPLSSACIFPATTFQRNVRLIWNCGSETILQLRKNMSFFYSLFLYELKAKLLIRTNWLCQSQTSVSLGARLRSGILIRKKAKKVWISDWDRLRIIIRFTKSISVFEIVKDWNYLVCNDSSRTQVHFKFSTFWLDQIAPSLVSYKENIVCTAKVSQIGLLLQTEFNPLLVFEQCFVFQQS